MSKFHVCTYEYSSCPAVSKTSRRTTSLSIMHCFLYESLMIRMDTQSVVRTFNCGIIFVNKMILAELNCKSRFSYTTATNDDKLEFS